MMRKTYPVCAHCGHTMNPAAEDDCDRLYQLSTGELYCPPCFKDYLLDELDANMDLFADALGIPVLYTEGPHADI